jgi:hypothetical protein
MKKSELYRALRTELHRHDFSTPAGAARVSTSRRSTPTRLSNHFIACLHDGREVEAKDTEIVDSVVGRTVHIAIGAFALIVKEAQIIRTLED